MTDPTNAQLSNRLDRIEEIMVAYGQSIDTMSQAITQLTHVVEQAHERQERSLADHERRITLMEDVQRDTRQMLQLLINRTIGDD